MILALLGGLTVTAAAWGKRLTNYSAELRESNKGLPTPVSIDTRTKLLGLPLCGLSLKALRLSAVLEAVVLGVVQICFDGNQIFDLGGSPTSRQARREHKQ